MLSIHCHYFGRFTVSGTVIEEFIIRATGPKEFVSRSVVLQKDITERIDKLSENNWQYSKKAIINKLLDEALKKYGY